MGRKTALLFPGQGSQHLGMLDGVPENEDLSRLLDAAEALSELRLRSIATSGPEEDLADTRAAQPLLYLADWAWGVALIEGGIEPQAVAGHSLGEIAALAIAGVFSVEAGLELVIERSQLMASAARSADGSMSAVIGLDAGAISEALREIDGVWLANDNAPGQIVISGRSEAVDAAGPALTARGARKVVPLKVAGAFHSPLMERARSSFADILVDAEFADAWIPVYQNTAPEATLDGDLIRRRLIDQIASPVRWTETMQNLVSDGVAFTVEAGPGSVLTGLAKRVNGLSILSAEAVGLDRVLEEVS
jgi:[acyl-carrier-protein] S-malonyltransferase